MLQLKKKQLKVFETSARDDFVQRLLTYLQTLTVTSGSESAEPAQDAPQWDMERVEKVIIKAGHHGLTTEVAVAEFATLIDRYGDDFEYTENHSWIQSVLDDTHLTEEGKMQRINSGLSSELPLLTGFESR